MFAGVIQRLSNYIYDDEKRERYCELADSVIRYLLNIKIEQKNLWYWNYFHAPLSPTINKLEENDLLHACYTIDGLLMYKKYKANLLKK
jgi:hypothetical protein